MSETDALQFAVDAAKAAQAAAEKAAASAASSAASPDWAQHAQDWLTVLILLLFIAFFVFNYSKLIAMIDRLKSVKAAGVEVTFNEKQQLAAAIDEGPANQRVATTVSEDRKKIRVSQDDRDRALKRAAMSRDLLKDLVFLWIDDDPNSNMHESELLQSYGAKVFQVRNSSAAQDVLTSNKVDIILSDIKRDGQDEPALEFAKTLIGDDKRYPLIFYVTDLKPDAGTPPGAFGITNRPDELLHLILDAAERTRPLV